MLLPLGLESLLLLGGTAVAPPPAPSYSRQIDPLLRRYCAGCHGKRMPRAGYSVIAYEELFRSRKGKIMLVAGQPDKSPLLRTMQGHPPVMPPPDYPHRPSPADIAKVRAWIAAGAQDDTPAELSP